MPWTRSSLRLEDWEVPVHSLDLRSLQCKYRGSLRCWGYCCSCHGDKGCWCKDPQQAEMRPQMGQLFPHKKSGAIAGKLARCLRANCCSRKHCSCEIQGLHCLSQSHPNMKLSSGNRCPARTYIVKGLPEPQRPKLC